MKYDRSLFRFKSKEARDHIKKTMDVNGNGWFLDPYNGVLIQKFDAEHIIPLKSAWESGFSSLYSKDKRYALELMIKFANDHRNLCPTKPGSNRSRGCKTLWNWSPLNLSFIPERNRIVRKLYSEYGLTLSLSQKWALDWSDYKITKKYKQGIHLGKVRSWLFDKGFHRILMPF